MLRPFLLSSLAFRSPLQKKTHALRRNTLRVSAFGDVYQLSLANYPTYVGLDISPSAVRLCAQRFVDDRTKSFFWYEPALFFDRTSVFAADLALSLDVILHLVEEEAFELYMRNLCRSATRFIAIYSSNFDDDTHKNAIHVRHRMFTRWIDANQPEWRLWKTISNRYPYQGDDQTGSFSNFYLFQRSTPFGDE